MNENSKLILIVDDEPEIRRFLRVTLNSNDFNTLEAANAIEALNLASKNNIDLIILDLGLPDKDGLVVTENIRQWSQIPIIILSARAQEADKVKALEAGADDYLTKPFGVQELLARIKVALRHKTT